MLINLIYGSDATSRFSQEELIEILNDCRRNNKKLDVTGMLLYHDGNFIQVLEGEQQIVEDLYQKIAKDSRHENLLTYVKQPIDKRQFGDWEMGFVDVEQIGADNIPGYTKFISDPDHSTKLENASYAYAFLNVFRENIR